MKVKHIFLSILCLLGFTMPTNAQDYFMTSIAPVSELASSIPGDFKITPKSGTASSYQGGAEISKAFDGDMATMYHSSWSVQEFPITLVFNIAEEDLDYLIYNPRTSGSNGNFKEVEIYYTSVDKSEKTLIGAYDFAGSGNASKVKFSEQLSKVKTIEFTILSGAGDGNGFASCAEMEFYRINPARDNNTTLFADKLLTKLKDGVSMNDIDAMENPFFRELATNIYKGNYSLNFRTRECEAYMDRSSFSKLYSVSAYNLHENPTGIYFPLGKNVIVVENLEEGRNVSLVIPHYLGQTTDNWSLQSRSYPLQEGINVVDVKDFAGIGYISYFTPDWEEAGKVNIHIPMGIVQGYFDASIHTNEDFVEILANANAYPFLDLVGNRTQITYTVEAYRNYTDDVTELVKRYDNMVLHQQKYMGWQKYEGLPKNRVQCRANGSYYMYKDNAGASFEYGTMYNMANSVRFYGGPSSDNNWGPCHEVGHIHQYKFNNWSGMGETSVNFPNRFFRYYVVDPTYSDEEDRFKAGLTAIKGKTALLKYGDVGVTLIPFSQLFYYFMEKGYADFFPDLNRKLRTSTANTEGWTSAQYELHFAKAVCDLTELDLVDFFVDWGMLYCTDLEGREPFTIDDYGTGHYAFTTAELEEFREYIKEKGYDKPDEDVCLVKPLGGRFSL
ncbi:hypothetical protein M2138_000510 [Dysgonomonadaceae bacterium PH5-43]|nr:hypothetical protein [Dysgonomonadaceae bacterium PH5-43]